MDFSIDFKADFVGFLQKPNNVGIFVYIHVFTL